MYNHGSIRCLVSIIGRLEAKMVADQEEMKACQEAVEAMLEKEGGQPGRVRGQSRKGRGCSGAL
jgi:hypothetical protein